jgi:SWI/SNF-related matrix-associated actin-dependent regulator of chromatin subfamily A-like protein 1
MTVTETPERFIISFGFNPKMIADIKKVPGWNYDREKKTWSVPALSRPQLNEFLARYGQGLIKTKAYNEHDLKMPDLDFELNLKRVPFPYQRQGIAYALQKQRVIMGDQPGLGKTLQAIGTLEAAMQQRKQTYPALIICPASLKENWKREFELTSNRRAVVLSDKMVKSWPNYIKTGLADVLIVNYESLKKYFVAETNIPKGESLMLKYIKFRPEIDLFKSVVIDEIHRLKDTGTAQSKYSRGICKGKAWILGLTGTPVVNKPNDLISQLGIIERFAELFGTLKQFQNRFCSKNTTRADLQELNYVLKQNCFFQRKKQDVLKQLPDKVRQIILCDITTRKEYQEAIANLSQYLREYRAKSEQEIEISLRGQVMVQIGICKNISARGKLNEVSEHINEVIESGEKIIVFIHQKEIAQALLKLYPHAVTVTGSDTTETRQANVDRFQKDPKANIIICNIKAGGVGITLTASSRVAFVELPWHAADADQCEDRAHRIGQKDSVQCTYFLGANTIDTHIYNIIEEKRAMAGQITGNEDSTQKQIINKIAEILLD